MHVSFRVWEVLNYSHNLNKNLSLIQITILGFQSENNYDLPDIYYK